MFKNYMVAVLVLGKQQHGPFLHLVLKCQIKGTAIHLSVNGHRDSFKTHLHKPLAEVVWDCSVSVNVSQRGKSDVGDQLDTLEMQNMYTDAIRSPNMHFKLSCKHGQNLFSLEIS